MGQWSKKKKESAAAAKEAVFCTNDLYPFLALYPSLYNPFNRLLCMSIKLVAAKAFQKALESSVLKLKD